MLVLLADELDYLFTRSQQVIYKLLDWPQSPFSHLVVIVAMMDTIDLPERLLSLRNLSRISMHRVAFRPYSRQQIAAIIDVGIISSR